MGNQIKKTGPKPRVYSDSDCAKAWMHYVDHNETAIAAAGKMKITTYRLLKMIEQEKARRKAIRAADPVLAQADAMMETMDRDGFAIFDASLATTKESEGNA